jgi:4-diphosphocytidyl-2-C-methyl-D-erythritol kinase
MVIFPKSKINIGLRITEKRPDGFHNLETIFYPVCLCDAIEFVVPKEYLQEDCLKVTGISTGIDNSNNLVIEAVKRIRLISNIPFIKVHLHKAIPVGAGLGGGSSDAAFIIKALNKYFKIGLTDERILDISLGLGSDCPFFIECLPAHAAGRGEILTQIKPVTDGFHLLMVNPGININTREAFSRCKPGKPDTDLITLYSLDISQWKDLIINDFEEIIFRIHPQIEDLKKSMYNLGAVYSSMSGSGSTVYGIFNRAPEIPSNLQDQVIYSGNL